MVHDEKKKVRPVARGFRPSRRVAVVAAAVVVVVAVAGIWLLRRSAPAEQATSTTATVTTATLSQTVSASGTIEPKVQSNLSFTSGGTVTSVPVKVGDKVTTGQTLATIGTTDLQQAVDSAQASVDAASASLKATKSSSTATSAQIAAATSQLNAADAKLATAQSALAAASLHSPIDGTVATVNIDVGSQVSGSAASAGSSGSGSSASGSSAGGSSSGSSSAGSSAQVVVIATDAWVVNTSVSASDLPLVKADLQAQIVPTGATSPVFGTVSSVGVIASTSSGVASFPVTVAVTGNPSGLYAGGSAAVSIVVKEITDALVVPTAAIGTVDGKTVVTQVKDGQQVSTPVTLGMVQGNQTQITAGLSQGDQVLVTRTGGFGQGGGTATRTRGTSTSGRYGGQGAPPAGVQGGAPAGGQGAPPAGGGQ
ncbi:MAG: efflux RND transporter periplasmic adaptor subunit [Dermatophilaceae bacterium]